MKFELSHLTYLAIFHVLLSPPHPPPVGLVLLGPSAALDGDLHALVAVGRLHVLVEVDILHAVLVHELLVVGGQVGGQGQGQEGQQGQHGQGQGHTGLVGQGGGI